MLREEHNRPYQRLSLTQVAPGVQHHAGDGSSGAKGTRPTHGQWWVPPVCPQSTSPLPLHSPSSYHTNSVTYAPLRLLLMAVVIGHVLQSIPKHMVQDETNKVIAQGCPRAIGAWISLYGRRRKAYTTDGQGTQTAEQVGWECATAELLHAPRARNRQKNQGRVQGASHGQAMWIWWRRRRAPCEAGLLWYQREPGWGKRQTERLEDLAWVLETSVLDNIRIILAFGAFQPQPGISGRSYIQKVWVGRSFSCLIHRYTGISVSCARVRFLRAHTCCACTPLSWVSSIGLHKVSLNLWARYGCGPKKPGWTSSRSLSKSPPGPILTIVAVISASTEDWRTNGDGWAAVGSISGIYQPGGRVSDTVWLGFQRRRQVSVSWWWSRRLPAPLFPRYPVLARNLQENVWVETMH